MERNFKLPDVDPRIFFRESIKSVKAQLPKSCTFLAPYKTAKDQYLVKAIIKKGDKEKIEKFYSIPPNFIYTAADRERLKSEILSHC